MPNHVAPDHPWVQEHPDYFIQGTPEDFISSPQAFLQGGDHILAHGRDPYSPPWPDGMQVNAFAPGLRQALIDTLISMASQWDGVRGDMALLLINQIFRKARAAAVTIATLPGARLFHEGQLKGRRIRLPVFLNRRPPEPVDSDLQNFYQTLLAAVAQPVFKAGEWRLGSRSGWPDNRSYLHTAAWGWRLGEERRLIIFEL
ncbi:MAG: hypothetical protein WBV23_08845 [Desulfobaccales bacterium]